MGVGGVALVRPVVGRLDLSNLQKRKLRDRKLYYKHHSERSTETVCKIILIIYIGKYKLHQKSLNKQVDSTDLKVLTNEKRGGLKVVAFDKPPFKLFTLRFSTKSVQAPSCKRPKTTQRILFLLFESNI